MVLPLRRLAAVVDKDVRSELRTRYGITALLLFAATAVVLVAFSAADEPMPRPLAAGFLWVVMLYTAMTGLGRGFIVEEERGTALYLRASTTASAVFFGKLVVNVVLALMSNLVAATLFMFFMGSAATVGSVPLLLATVAVGSVGLASVLTVVSAIVAKAGTRSALLPVLSFPMLLPLLLPGTNAMLRAFAGTELPEATRALGLMSAYTGIMVVISWIVFDTIWSD